MIRVLIIAIIAFSLPFLIYALSNSFGSKNKSDNNVSIWANAPYPFLSIIGLLLAIGSIVSLVLWSEGKL